MTPLPAALVTLSLATPCNLATRLYGNGGDDVVNVAIYGNGAVLTGLNTTGIETISVKALTTANEGSTLDLSSTKT